jgi:hypothetical protein
MSVKPFESWSLLRSIIFLLSQFAPADRGVAAGKRFTVDHSGATAMPYGSESRKASGDNLL